MNPRRSFFRGILGLGAGAVGLARSANAQQVESKPPSRFGPPVPVVTPDIPDLPFTVDNGVKVFHLTAEPVKQVIIPTRTFDLWGFNGSAPGPTIQANEGDRIRIIFENHLPEATGIHWHGLELPIEMDGVLAQARDIEFVADRVGDWMFHCHLPHHMMNQMASNVGPMTRSGQGMQTGGSMEEAMGMLRDGHATADNKAPSLGRGLGIGATAETPVTNGPLTQREADKAMSNMPGMDHSMHSMDHGGMPGMAMPEVPKNANQVPLFPQDAFMESPMMAMDKEVDKPEVYGLPMGWSGFVGGMMTLVRVLPPEQYEKIMDLKARYKAPRAQGKAVGEEHQHDR